MGLSRLWWIHREGVIMTEVSFGELAAIIVDEISVTSA
jgi:hypothetical protein